MPDTKSDKKSGTQPDTGTASEPNGSARDWVRLDRHAPVAVLVLAAPEQLNGIHAPMMRQLHARLAEVAADDAIRALVLTGEGRGFCAGAHVGEMAGFSDKGPAVGRLLDEGWNRAVRQIRALRKPVVAAVKGIAAGGGVGLALACDIVLAARSASFIQVFGPRLGVVPDVGSTWFLPQALGRARALHLMLTGDPLKAETAADWGLIAGCVEDGELMDEALALAGRLARGPVAAFAEIREAVAHGLASTLDAALDLERDVNARLAGGPDFAEGTAAFVEKREPRFCGA